MNTLNVKPRDGFQIRDPDLRDLIPEAGRVVPDTAYWQRRLRDGDVELIIETKPLKSERSK